MPVTPSLVEQAASFLKNGRATPKEKLAIAGKFVWAATMVPNGWTPELLEQAKAACKFLFKDGHLERTVRRMDEALASRYLQQFTRNITQLAVDIEEAKSQPPPPHKSKNARCTGSSA